MRREDGNARVGEQWLCAGSRPGVGLGGPCGLEPVGCLGVTPRLRVATVTGIPGLPAGSWLSGIRTRMLPECCQAAASNVLCVLMDKININLHFFFLFPFYLIFSSSEDFSLLLPPLPGTKITCQQGLDVADVFVLSSSQALLLIFSCRHVLGPFACSAHVRVLRHRPVPKRWMDEAKTLSECRNGFCSHRQSCR